MRGRRSSAPEPVLRRTALPLEVERGQRPLRTDPFQHTLRNVCVVLEHLLPARAAADTEPRELARRHEREPLVVRLDDLAALVQLVAPGGLVVCDPRVQHQIMAAARDVDRVELDRAQPAQNLKTTRVLLGDLHLPDATAIPDTRLSTTMIGRAALAP